MDTEQLEKLMGVDRWAAFATMDDDQPRVRMMTVRWHGGSLWSFTSAFSAKGGQLKRNDKFEFVIHMAGEGNVSSLRAAGRAEMIGDPSIREELAAASPSFKEHWSSSDDPDFMLLRLNIDAVEIERGPDTKAERYTLDRPRGS